MKTKLPLLLMWLSCSLMAQSLKSQSIASNSYHSVKNIYAGDHSAAEQSLKTVLQQIEKKIQDFYCL